jgi:primase-polymerase (primpol)-like protein
MAYPEDWQERVTPFLEHVEFLVPNEGERERFLQWLAHIVRVPEVLPHTSYLMITPKTGVGRNLLASIRFCCGRNFAARDTRRRIHRAVVQKTAGHRRRGARRQR